MEKVTLTPETLARVQHKLDAFMKQPFIAQNAFDHVCEVCSPDVVWGGWMNTTYLKGDVSTHNLYRNSRFFTKDVKPQPLIHAKLNDTHSTAFHDGDIFYFDGDTIFVDDTTSNFSVKGGRSTTSGTKMTRTTVTPKQMTAILKREAQDKEFEDDYWRMVDEDQRRDVELELEIEPEGDDPYYDDLVYEDYEDRWEN